MSNCDTCVNLLRGKSACPSAQANHLIKKSVIMSKVALWKKWEDKDGKTTAGHSLSGNALVRLRFAGVLVGLISAALLSPVFVPLGRSGGSFPKQRLVIEPSLLGSSKIVHANALNSESSVNIVT